MTRKTALAFGIGATLILAAGTASADCAAELVVLRDQLGAAEGAAGSAGSDTMTSTDTTASADTATDTADTTTETDTTASTDTTTDTTTDTMTESGAEQSTTTADSGTGTTGTITETSRTGEAMSGEQRDEALIVLGRAQVYSESGDETTCISELQKIKQEMNLPPAQ